MSKLTTHDIIKKAQKVPPFTFPCHRDLGLDPEQKKQEALGAAILYAVVAIRMAQATKGDYRNTPGFYRLDTMIEYDVVEPAVVLECLDWYIRRQADPGIGPYQPKVE
jgi:hypothetical protein